MSEDSLAKNHKKANTIFIWTDKSVRFWSIIRFTVSMKSVLILDAVGYTRSSCSTRSRCTSAVWTYFRAKRDNGSACKCNSTKDWDTGNSGVFPVDCFSKLTYIEYYLITAWGQLCSQTKDHLVTRLIQSMSNRYTMYMVDNLLFLCTYDKI